MIGPVHLDDDIPDLAIALEQLLHVPVPGVIGDVSEVNFVVSHARPEQEEMLLHGDGECLGEININNIGLTNYHLGVIYTFTGVLEDLSSRD